MTADADKLLIIDDDPSLGKTLLTVLRKSGYDVEWVTTGQEGVDFVQQR